MADTVSDPLSPGADAIPGDHRHQINQQNAQHSTGPKTPEGKAASSRNALRHGLCSQLNVLPGVESREEWEQFRDGLLAELAPVGVEEDRLAERVARMYWQLRRVERYEAEAFERELDPETGSGFLPDPVIARVCRYGGYVSRELRLARQELRALQEGRKAAADAERQAWMAETRRLLELSAEQRRAIRGSFGQPASPAADPPTATGAAAPAEEVGSFGKTDSPAAEPPAVAPEPTPPQRGAVEPHAAIRTTAAEVQRRLVEEPEWAQQLMASRAGKEETMARAKRDLGSFGKAGRATTSPAAGAAVPPGAVGSSGQRTAPETPDAGSPPA